MRIWAIRQGRAALPARLKIREAKLGPDHPDVAASLNNLATLYQTQGKYAEAEPLYQRASRSASQAGRQPPRRGRKPQQPGALVQTQGKYAKAEPLYQRAWGSARPSSGPDHSRRGRHPQQPGDPVSSTGPIRQGRAALPARLQSGRPSSGQTIPTWPTTSTTGDLYKTQASTPRPSRSTSEPEDPRGKLGRITPTWRHPQQPAERRISPGQLRQGGAALPARLEIQEAKLGKDHPDVAATLNNLADCTRAGQVRQGGAPLPARLAIRGQARRGPPRRGPNPQQPGQLYRPGQVRQGGAALPARAGNPRGQARQGPPRRGRSLNNLAISTRHRASTPRRSRSTSARWRSRSKLGADHPDVATTSTTWPILYRRRASTPRRRRSTGAPGDPRGARRRPPRRRRDPRQPRPSTKRRRPRPGARLLPQGDRRGHRA